MELFAEIILPLPLNQTYTYAVPAAMQSNIQIGMRVVVNFGSRKFYTGVVYSLHHNRPPYDNVKSVELLLDDRPIVRTTQLDLWNFVSTYYRSKLGDIYKAAVPSAMKPESETVIAINMDMAAQAELTPAQMQLLDLIPQEGTITIKELTKRTEAKQAIAMVRTLAEKGILIIDQALVGKYKAKYEVCFKLNPLYDQAEPLHNLLTELKKKPKQLAFVNTLSEEIKAASSPNDTLMVRKEFLQKHNFSLSIYNALEKQDIVQTILRQKDRIVIGDSKLQPSSQLTPAQQQAFDQINQHFQTKETVLLHGVTSSGKTEIYIKLIEQTIARGEQVLFLVPEIGLTTQLANRLRRIFGSKLGVYHSRFSDQERVEIWNNLLLDKGYQLLLGVRSSVFLPFRKLGLVIVDEEHDASYKQQDPAPRYHAGNIAQMLGHLHHAKILLGSATPSIESYTNCLTHKYELVTLNTRYNDLLMPNIELVDLKECYHKRQMEGHLSEHLITAIKQALQEHKQVILFQNRRGYAPYVVCTNCGWVPRCSNCDVSLTYHKAFNKLTCHYCGHTQYLPQECPVCHQDTLTTKGFGTEQVEHEVMELFPQVKVARMDLDTTRTKRSFEQLIDQFENQQIDILIGTQMISKGLDFQNVALIGILNADNLLNYPDFRAYERAFQMLVQVSGRAGRKSLQGKVIIQTSQITNPLITQVRNNDYQAFFDQQMVERQNFHYPPYYRLIRIVVKHRQAEVVNQVSNQLADALKEKFGRRVLGPDVPAVGRIQNLFIKHLLLKIEVTASFERAKTILDTIINQQIELSKQKGTQIYLDIDPM